MGLENTHSNRKKVGLALGSGAARGLAHIGVLRVLEREGIPVDMITGTSIGAIVGALYAQGKKADEILEIARDFGTHRLSYLVDISLPRTGLIKGKKLDDKLAQLYAGEEFKDLKLPFKCMATDIDTGKVVIMDKGLVWTAVRASISLPVISRRSVRLSHSGRWKTLFRVSAQRTRESHTLKAIQLFHIL